MSLSTQIRQSQKQTATPLMMMGFSLLQLPIGELREAVKKELETNPALEVESARFPHAASPASASAETLENVADSRGETLDEHLLSELRMTGVADREFRLAQAIVQNLDGDGRFTGSYPDLIMVLSGAGERTVSEAELESARARILSIDPKGCGARNLAECYRAQLGAIPAAKRAEASRAIDELEAAIRENRLDSFRPTDLKAFMLLKRLDPYPGRLYDRVRTDYVTPDIQVDAEGTVTVDTRDIPELRVSAKYIEMAKDRELDAETRTYAADRVKKAREFREALLRRGETLEAIAVRTLARQADFLEKGPIALKKLTMSEIAKETKCTVSTVSRAAARKYVKTPRGTIPLRKFFVLVDPAPVEKLKALLAAIPAGARISDRELSERLAKSGYSMARRTVSKYRRRLT